MKRCGTHPVLHALVFLLVAAMMTATAGFACWVLRHDPTLTPDENRLLVLLVLLLLVLGAALGRRVLCMGQTWLEYDEIQVLFHLSHWETRVVPWREIAGPKAKPWHWSQPPKVTFRRAPLLGWVAVFREDGKQLPVYWTAEGYREFIRTLKKKGGFR